MVVVGSVGKTSTKVAIGTVLSDFIRVRLHNGNHNSELSAPLAILGVAYPENIKSLGQWWQVFRAVRKRIKQPADVDVVVQELGTDRVGQIPHFGKYLQPDIAVITAVSPEHMEYFKTLDAVAAEELSAANFSKMAIINRDDIAGEYAKDITNGNIRTYGTTSTAEYRFETSDHSILDGFEGMFVAPDGSSVTSSLSVVGEHSIRSVVAAGAVGVEFGISPQDVAASMKKIKPVAGRMNILKGVEGSTLIDDTYNSSPLAVVSALRTLYEIDSPQRIAVLGSMNELGDSSAAEHEAVGKLCDYSLLSHVITVGNEAAKYLAPSAQAAGCQVTSFKSSLEAGAYLHKLIEPGAVVLFKGSQGAIFLEEAVKIVLHSSDDTENLVRQSADWQAKKQAYFDSISAVSESDD